MARNQKWIWLVLSIVLFVLVGALGTSWNLVILNNYEKMVAVAGKSLPEEWRSYPWWTIGLGSLGFLSILALSIVFTVKLLREMRANQARSEFLALISHELRSPLATLELSSNLLESEAPQKESTQKLWRSHKSELERLKIEIERLLTASRWESLRDRPAMEPVELVSWLKNRESRWSAILGDQSRLSLNTPPEALWILANSDYLDLIMNNFVDNARKFAKNSAPDLEINLETTESKGRTKWRISFRDFGTGFDPKFRKKIFRRFYRVPTPLKRASGSGLGLYLVKHAAKKMHFKVSAESFGFGQGSAFRLDGEIRE